MRISLALSHSALTSDSFKYSHRFSLSICSSKSIDIATINCCDDDSSCDDSDGSDGSDDDNDDDGNDVK